MAGYKKILVLLDLSDASEQIAVAARDMAAHSNAAMVILHVVEFVPSEPMGETLMPTIQIEEDLMQRSRVKIDELRARLALPRATSRSTSCARAWRCREPRPEWKPATRRPRFFVLPRMRVWT